MVLSDLFEHLLSLRRLGALWEQRARTLDRFLRLGERAAVAALLRRLEIDISDFVSGILGLRALLVIIDDLLERLNRLVLVTQIIARRV